MTPEKPTDLELLRAMYQHLDRAALRKKFSGLTDRALDAFFKRLATNLPVEEPATTPPASHGAHPDLVLHTDGGSRGNPGPAGCGAVLTTPSGDTVREISEYLGRRTNNEAEYAGLLLGLEAAREAGACRIRIRADSDLMIRQLNGQYRVKSPKLAPLYQRARSLLDEFTAWEAKHVPRAMNAHADRLANEAMDRAC